jgi:hypothetical protein
VVTGTQPTQPTLECYQTATFNTTTCQWVVTGTPGEVSPCFSATLVTRTVNSNNTTTFTYDVCAKSCGSGLSHVSFITATNIGVVSPKNGSTYKTAKFSYRVTVPVYIDKTTTIWGIKFDVTNKEGLKGTQCDRFVFTMTGNVPESAITAIEFKAGQQVTRQTSTGGCQGSGSVSNPVTLQNKVTEQQVISDLSVKAFPNPYTDKVRFVINSPESGQGSLEVFNVLGQKVKTVYQGHIISGTQSFEMNVPSGFRSTLIYRLNVNGKQVTGKLLSARD